MTFEYLPKEIVSVFVAILMLIAFIPVFSSLGVNYAFVYIFIFGFIIVIIFAFLSHLKEM